jgi:hypothetical protein
MSLKPKTKKNKKSVSKGTKQKKTIPLKKEALLEKTLKPLLKKGGVRIKEVNVYMDDVDVKVVQVRVQDTTTKPEILRKIDPWQVTEDAVTKVFGKPTSSGEPNSYELTSGQMRGKMLMEFNFFYKV